MNETNLAQHFKKFLNSICLAANYFIKTALFVAFSIIYIYIYIYYIYNVYTYNILYILYLSYYIYIYIYIGVI